MRASSSSGIQEADDVSLQEIIYEKALFIHTMSFFVLNTAYI